jgi:hypothetical protein
MKKDFGFIFWVHLVLLILYVLSPLLINWWLIILIITALQIQFHYLGGCILTQIQLNEKTSKTFVWYYLEKFFPNVVFKNERRLFTLYIPLIIFLIAIIIQVFLGYVPVIYL